MWVSFGLCLYGIALFASGAIAKECECHTVTIMKGNPSCPTSACSVRFLTTIPPAVPECPRTPTITSTMACPTDRDCFTSWTTTTRMPSDCDSFVRQTDAPAPNPTQSTPGPGPSDDQCLAIPVSDNIYNIPLDSAYSFTTSEAAFNISNEAPTPIDYKLVFKSKMTSIKTSAYLGDRTLSIYDPFLCANECDNIRGCVGFNLFFERDPVLQPGPYCENPSAGINIKCTLWGNMLDASMAVYSGETKGKFRIAITGSNAYTYLTPWIGPPITATPAPGQQTTTTMYTPRPPITLSTPSSPSGQTTKPPTTKPPTTVSPSTSRTPTTSAVTPTASYAPTTAKSSSYAPVSSSSSRTAASSSYAPATTWTASSSYAPTATFKSSSYAPTTSTRPAASYAGTTVVTRGSYAQSSVVQSFAPTTFAPTTVASSSRSSTRRSSASASSGTYVQSSRSRSSRRTAAS